MDETLIVGIGDEIVLFIVFVFISLIFVFFMTRRRNLTGAVATGAATERRNIISESEDVVADTSTSDIRYRPTVTDRTFSLRLVTLQSSQTVTVSERTTLQQLQRQYFLNEISSGQTVQFIYQGRLLTNNEESLIELGIQENTSLHVHLSSTRRTEETNLQYPLDLSGFLVPIVSLMFGICWICLFMLPHMFTFSTKLMLFVLSLGFVFFVYRS